MVTHFQSGCGLDFKMQEFGLCSLNLYMSIVESGSAFALPTDVPE